MSESKKLVKPKVDNTKALQILEHARAEQLKHENARKKFLESIGGRKIEERGNG